MNNIQYFVAIMQKQNPSELKTMEDRKLLALAKKLMECS